jgi:hypothetical protein
MLFTRKPPYGLKILGRSATFPVINANGLSNARALFGEKAILLPPSGFYWTTRDRVEIPKVPLTFAEPDGYFIELP